MALPNIDINIGNGALGLTVPTNDALTGMIVQGIAPTGLALLTPTLLTSLQDAVDLGIDEAYDSTNSLVSYKAIKEFYEEAGTGSQLWIMVVGQAISMETVFDKTEADYVLKLLNAAGGGIRILTMVRNPAAGYAPTVALGVDSDVTAAIVKAQSLAEEYVKQYKPFRVVLPAYGYSGVASDLEDLKTRSDNRVAVMVGDTETGLNAAIGVLAGRLASVPVMRNVGRVKSGSLPVLSAYVATETVEVAAGDVEVIHDKGYITFRTHIGKAGYFFSDDPTATSSTDDYSSLSNGRVLDKAIYLAYTTYVDELLDEILIDPSTGQIATVQAKALQQLVETVINTSMTANNEISGVSAEVDPNQNVLSTGMVCVKLRLTTVGYKRIIKIDLGFANAAA